jgi:choline-glycine betaine transporter
MTIRYIFWPLIGEKCYGWMGDCIDILSIITTIAGVCTSLGLGAMQINRGMQRLNHGSYRGFDYRIPNEPKYSNPLCGGHNNRCDVGQESYGIQYNVDAQNVIIIVVTLIATLSVISGISRGIVNLSRFTFALGMFIIGTVLLSGETYFILDVIVETLGSYLFYFFSLSFHTDAWTRLGSQTLGLGGAPDNNGGSSKFMEWWTVFYWGWWISWAPFVGTFLAKISRGRTLRQFILGSLVLPSLYSFWWFGTLGAEAIRMHRMATTAGLCSNTLQGSCQGIPGHLSADCNKYADSFNETAKRANNIGFSPTCVLDWDYHGGFGKCQEFKWARNEAVGDKCVWTTSWVTVPCGAAADPTAYAVPTSGPCLNVVTATHTSGPLKNGNFFPPASNPGCFVPAPDNLVCLGDQGINDQLWDLLSTYGPRGFSDFICIIALVALVFYFVTSSDSGSLVVDILSSNGHPDPPIPQRIFWAFTEGAVAIALLNVGKDLQDPDAALKALRSASLITGLPYTFVLFYAGYSLVLLCKEECGELNVDRKAFNTFIWNLSQPVRLAINLVLPGMTMGKVVQRVGGWPLTGLHEMAGVMFWSATFQLMYLWAFILLWCGFVLYNWVLVSLVLYFGFAAFLSFLRTSLRKTYAIKHGDMMTDFLCAFCLPMFTLVQMEEQMKEKEEAPQQEYKDI